MNKKTKKLLGFGFVFGVLGIVLTSCNSFCSAEDSASYRFAYDPINTTFFESKETAVNYVYESLVGENAPVYTSTSSSEPITLEFVANMTVRSVVDGDIVNTPLIKSTTSEASDFSFSDDIANNGEIFYLETSTITVYYHAVDSEGTVSSEWSSRRVTFSKNSFIRTLESNGSSVSSGQTRPTINNLPANAFWNMFDAKAIENMISKANSDGYISSILSNQDNAGITSYEFFYGYNEKTYSDYQARPTEEKLEVMLNGGTYTFEDNSTDHILGRNNSLFAIYGKYKFVSDETVDALNMSDGDYWSNIIKWNSEIKAENKNIDGLIMNDDYINYYQTLLNTNVAALNSCIALEDGFYGHIGNDELNDTVLITDKSDWGEAWSHGWLEGLLVYPIAYMVETFSHAFGMNGWGQIWAVLLVTLIVRAFFSLLTLPSTISQQKMQYLQPELQRLQQKYPNAQNNEYEKQKLAQAQMNLYKRHKVHPFASMLVIFIQFPLFISVWNGMRGAASLSVDAVLGLRLSDTISSVLFTWSNWPQAQCWTALVLILLMSAAQILAMQLPQILTKIRMKQTQNMVSKTVKSDTQNKSQTQMKIVSWVMTIMIIVMGFSLPSAMGVYWLAGALFSMLQTLILHFVMIKTMGGKGKGNKVIDKTKKEKKFSNLFKKKDKNEDQVVVDAKTTTTSTNEESKIIDVEDLSTQKDQKHHKNKK